MTHHQVEIAASNRVRQGDIFSNVPYFESYVEKDGQFQATIFEFPYVVVLTQDCDLEQNKSARAGQSAASDMIQNDKHLISIIVAPLYNSEHLFAGEHLKEIGVATQRFNSDLRKRVISNQNTRYHYIAFDSSVTLPNSVVDFKHYFSVSLGWLENQMSQRTCVIAPLYRELLSQRFANYLSRIGLPDLPHV